MTFTNTTNEFNTMGIYTLGIVGIVFACLMIGLAIAFLTKRIKRNYFFGYHTPFSFFSDETWDWANKRFAKYILLIDSFLLLVHIVFFILSLIVELSYIFPLITLLLMLVNILFIVPYIEIKGRKLFDYKNKKEKKN